ncbi:hypothetical protein L6164_003255 [Bauhinia variegata]|uniref:Uncharacterized protein n=1 Tax=Bauhinia variegata TaxID=167791 RepID=A0ACB9PZW9_BAUVA|nr:hypothetical protein L6164_003255 [Bauhinia variegata]
MQFKSRFDLSGFLAKGQPLSVSTKSVYLPNDLLIEILSKLPVKSLCRFKCVSKLWLSLICDPLFAKVHIKNQKPKLILTLGIGKSLVQFMKLESPFYEGNNRLTCPWRESKQDIYSCNGLLMARDCDHFYLWNPTTGFYKKFPYPVAGVRGRGTINGFGYDSSIDDYKVLHIVGVYEGTSAVFVFTMKTNSWRRIHHFPYTYIPTDFCALHGALHWNLPFGIVYFNLEKKKYGELPLPNHAEKSPVFDLALLGNNLTVTYYKMDSKVYIHSAVVWTMKEYGVSKSWTKLFVIFPIDLVGIGKRLSSVNPVYVNSEGEAIMLINRRKLVVYDPKKTSQKMKVIGKFYLKEVQGTLVESVVSPGDCMLLQANNFRVDAARKRRVKRCIIECFSWVLICGIVLMILLFFTVFHLRTQTSILLFGMDVEN